MRENDKTKSLKRQKKNGRFLFNHSKMSPICLTYVLLSRFFFFSIIFRLQDNSNIVFLKSKRQKKRRESQKQKPHQRKTKNVLSIVCTRIKMFSFVIIQSDSAAFLFCFIVYLFWILFFLCCCFYNTKVYEIGII